MKTINVQLRKDAADVLLANFSQQVNEAGERATQLNLCRTALQIAATFYGIQSGAYVNALYDMIPYLKGRERKTRLDELLKLTNLPRIKLQYCRGDYLVWLGQVYCGDGLLADAETLFELACDHFAKTRQDRNDNVSEALHSFGDCCRDRGFTAKAEWLTHWRELRNPDGFLDAWVEYRQSGALVTL